MKIARKLFGVFIDIHQNRLVTPLEQMTGMRQGFGNILAEGSLRLATRYGRPELARVAQGLDLFCVIDAAGLCVFFSVRYLVEQNLMVKPLGITELLNAATRLNSGDEVTLAPPWKAVELDRWVEVLMPSISFDFLKLPDVYLLIGVMHPLLSLT